MVGNLHLRTITPQTETDALLPTPTQELATTIIIFFFFIEKALSAEEREKGEHNQVINEPQNNKPLNQVSLNDCCSGNSAYDEVKRLIENQTVFRAGQLTSAVHSWCETTNDLTIIQFVKGVFLEFTQNCEPTQISARPSIFNSKEQLIVHQEIHKLLQKGVIKESHNAHREFISPIF